MLLYRWVNIFRGGVFGRKKKKKKISQKNHSNIERHDNIRGFFIAVSYECLFFSLKPF